MSKIISTIKTKAAKRIVGVSALAVVAAAGFGSSASAMSWSYPSGIMSSGYQNASANQSSNNSGNAGNSGQQSSSSSVDSKYNESTTLYYNHDVSAEYKAMQQQQSSFNNFQNFMNSMNKGATGSEGFDFSQYGW